jgi:hypothetical protein
MEWFDSLVIVVFIGYGVRRSELPAGEVEGVIPWGVFLQVGVYVCDGEVLVVAYAPIVGLWNACSAYA